MSKTTSRLLKYMMKTQRKEIKAVKEDNGKLLHLTLGSYAFTVVFITMIIFKS